MTRNPEGNVVELMGVPRDAAGETFTWGMAVSDDQAARKFYGEIVGLAEFEPWDLPPPYSMKMYLFGTAAGWIKFASPAGQRPRDADAGPDAPGLRSLTLQVADLATVRDGLAKRGGKPEGDQRLLVIDPDGNRIFIEQASGGAMDAALPRAAAQSARGRAQQLLSQLGDVTPRPHKEEIAEQ